MSMNIPPALVEAVQAAVERLSRPGIEGWGLRVSPDMEGTGDLMDTTEHIGCTSDTCAHVSHDPAAPHRRWVPKSGRLVELGIDEEPGEVLVRYYAHLDGDKVRYLLVEEPRFAWASAEYVDAVPDWVLARLAPGAAV